MLFVDVQAHAGELGLQFSLGLAAVVGEEEEFLVFLLEPGDKFLHAGQETVAVVDHAVHVADEAFFGE